jgi:hypothetical protein
LATQKNQEAENRTLHKDVSMKDINEVSMNKTNFNHISNQDITLVIDKSRLSPKINYNLTSTLRAKSNLTQLADFNRNGRRLMNNSVISNTSVLIPPAEELQLQNAQSMRKLIETYRFTDEPSDRTVDQPEQLINHILNRKRGVTIVPKAKQMLKLNKLARVGRQAKQDLKNKTFITNNKGEYDLNKYQDILKDQRRKNHTLSVIKANKHPNHRSEGFLP